MSRTLTTLHDEGRLDILRSIRDGVLTILEVYDAYQRKGLDSLPTAATVKPLKDAWEVWADELDCSDKHRISLGVSLGYFVGVAASATINDLPRLAEGLRRTLGGKHPRSFNLARSAALAFLRDTVKQSHALWSRCAGRASGEGAEARAASRSDARLDAKHLPAPGNRRGRRHRLGYGTDGHGCRGVLGPLGRDGGPRAGLRHEARRTRA